MVPLPLDKLPEFVNRLAATWSNRQLHPAKRQHALITAALLYGLRTEEVMNLRPRCVNTSEHTLRFQSVKGGPVRTVSTNESWSQHVLEVHTAMKLHQVERRSATPAKHRPRKNYRKGKPHWTNWLFLTLTKQKLNHSTINDAVKKATKETFGVEYTPHCCRHTAAVVCWNQTHDLKAVQLLLGHAYLATTERYLQTIVAPDSINTITWSLSKRPLTLFIPKGETA